MSFCQELARLLGVPWELATTKNYWRHTSAKRSIQNHTTGTTTNGSTAPVVTGAMDLVWRDSSPTCSKGNTSETAFYTLDMYRDVNRNRRDHLDLEWIKTLSKFDMRLRLGANLFLLFFSTYFSSHHWFSRRTSSSSSGVKSLVILNVLRISSGPFPLIWFATVLHAASSSPSTPR